MEIGQNNIEDIENNFVWVLHNLKKLQQCADNAERALSELEKQNKAKSSFVENLQGFNIERDDKRIAESIELDHNAMCYIKSLENTLEVVMQKYRDHTRHLIKETHLEYEKMFKSFELCSSTKKIEQNHKIISELNSMLAEYMRDGEAVTNALLEENACLKAENKTLRELYHASNMFKIEEVNNNQVNTDM